MTVMLSFILYEPLSVEEETEETVGAVVSVVVVELSSVVLSSSVVVSLSVVVEVVEEPLSLLLLQEMKVRLKRNMEKMMSRCFTKFPNWLVLEGVIV